MWCLRSERITRSFYPKTSPLEQKECVSMHYIARLRPILCKHVAVLADLRKKWSLPEKCADARTQTHTSKPHQIPHVVKIRHSLRSGAMSIQLFASSMPKLPTS
mmetsp:Transcript_62064/g.122737  ORF Transcript_62064/g.122737 Transcript_62064/m.122737 type:complete len:104 (-) Transcript_62064:133-444(-)